MANMRDIAFASVNLFNLQTPGAPTYPRARPYSPEEYAAKVAWIGDRLRRLDADVIAFQELWSHEALADVMTAGGLAETHALAFIKEGAWDGVAVACAVRAPWEIRAVERIKQFPAAMQLRKRGRTMEDIRAEPPAADARVDPERDAVFAPSHEDDEIKVKIAAFARSALRVEVGHAKARSPAPPPVHVYCAHLKSKLATPLDDAEYRDAAVRPHAEALGSALSAIRRLAEATALRIVVADRMRGADAPVVVLGDLNDGARSETVGILTGQPTFRVAALSRAAARSDAGLYPALALEQLRRLGDVYYTHEHRAVREVIDHALVSEQFYDWSEKRLWAFDGMTVLNDHLEPVERTGSDHGLLVARFRWAPARPA
jgi:endonuclease/exonuclease/phosphatase family metal-dependent hydrolase